MGKIYESYMLEAKIWEIDIGESHEQTSSVEVIYYSDLFKDPRFEKATTIGLMLSFFSQFSGAYAFLFFSNTLFEDMKVLNADWITTALAFFNLIGTTVVLRLVDIYGRRSLLLFGSFTIGITLNVAGIVTLT